MHFICMHMYKMKKVSEDLQNADCGNDFMMSKFLGFRIHMGVIFPVCSIKFRKHTSKTHWTQIILLLWFISDSFSDEVLLEEDEEEEEEEGDETMEEYKPVEPPPQVRPFFHLFTY